MGGGVSWSGREGRIDMSLFLSSRLNLFSIPCFVFDSFDSDFGL